MLSATLYCLTSTVAIGEAALAIASNVLLDGSDSWRYKWYTPFTAGLGVVTAVWTIVLLAYSHKPSSGHALTKYISHFLSFLVLAPAWIAMAVLDGTQVPLLCKLDEHPGKRSHRWCALMTSTFAVAISLSILCIANAIVVFIKASSSKEGWKSNIKSPNDDKESLSLKP